MITRGAITQIADRDGVSAVVVERDYVLTHIVDSLARVDGSSGLIFKGGTALRLCFYDDFRYSADLDFSLDGLEIAEALEVIRAAFSSHCVRRTAEPRPSERRSAGDPLRRTARARATRSSSTTSGRQARSSRQWIAALSAATPISPTKTRRFVPMPSRKLQESCAAFIQRQLCRDVSDLHRLFVQKVSTSGRMGDFRTEAPLRMRDSDRVRRASLLT